MNSIETLCADLAAIRAGLNQHMNRISSVQAELNSATHRIQQHFSDQEAGRSICHSLSIADGDLASGKSSLYSLKNELTTYVNLIRK